MSERWGKASEQYEIAELLPERRSRLRLLLEAALAGGPISTTVTVQIRDRRDGRIVYEFEAHSDVALREAVGSIERDLESLTPGDFEREYGIEHP